MIKNLRFCCFLITLTVGTAVGQSNVSDLSKMILSKDSLFWQAYNNCTVENFNEFVADEIEFYHDKGGITLGIAALNTSIKNNLCNNPGFRIRREAVPGTVKLFPLHQADVIYGAILSGDHYFYVTEGGKKEIREGLAKFTHLWLLKDGNWKMTRILSYDHGPAPYVNSRNNIVISPSRLKQFAGKYQGPNAGTITISPQNTHLSMTIDNNVSLLYPESANRFFMKERDITVEFVRDANGNVSKLVVSARDVVVEEAAAVK